MATLDKPYIPPYKQDTEYMIVTLDEYELPIFSASRPESIAEYTGMTRASVMSAITRGTELRGLDARIIRVKI